MAIYIRYRFFVSFVTWFALLMFYVLRANMSVSILAMNAKRTNVSRTVACPVTLTNTSRIKEDGPFNWNALQQGTVLSAFFYGYMIAHIAGAVCSTLIGPRYTLAISTAGATLFTFLTVPMSYAGYEACVVARFLVGLFSGPVYPIIHEIIGNWSPIEERTPFAVITHTGNIIGIIVNFSVGAYICNFDVDGWIYFIYFSGGLGILSLTLWLIFVYDHPWKHPFISEFEKKYIIDSLYPNGIPQDKHPIKNVPFRHLFKSKNVWMLGIAHFSGSFFVYMFLTGFTKYLSDIYGLDVETASYYTIIPFVANFICQIFVSFSSNYIITKKLRSVTFVRKTVTFIAFIVSCILIIPAGFLSCDQMTESIIILTIVCGFVGFMPSGYFVGMIDIAPKYAGYTMAIGSVLGSLSGIINPQIAGVFIQTYGSKEGWKYLFILTAVVSFFLVGIWLIWGTCEKRPWANMQATYDVKNSEECVKTQ